MQRVDQVVVLAGDDAAGDFQYQALSGFGPVWTDGLGRLRWRAEIPIER